MVSVSHPSEVGTTTMRVEF